jgi:hypothetical protein
MYYCKLYIDTVEEQSEIQEILNSLVQQVFEHIEVDADVFRNEDYDSTVGPNSPLYPVERSRFYVEMDSECERDDLTSEFQLGVARLVKLLRDGGRFVVASCDFEDLVSAETGWNWTPDNPLQPA